MNGLRDSKYLLLGERKISCTLWNGHVACKDWVAKEAIYCALVSVKLLALMSE